MTLAKLFPSAVFTCLLWISVDAQVDTVQVSIAADTLDASQQEGGLSPEALSLYNDGLNAYKKYQLDEAITAFSQALELEPNFAKAYYNRAAAYMEGKRYSLATPDLDRYLLIADTLTDAYFLRARAHHLLGHHGRAMQCYAETIDKGVKVGEASLYRAELHFLNGDMKAASNDFDVAIKHDANNAGAYQDRGSALMTLGRLKEAVADFEKAIKLDPGLSRAYANLGAAYRKMELYPEALTEFSQAVRLDGENAVVVNNRGYIHFLMEEYEKAERDFRTAVDLDPKYAFAHNNLAGALIKQERYKEAIDYASNAIKIDANYALAYLNRGIAREMIRDMTGACADWEKAAAMNVANAETYRSISCKY